jgi:hypothetical protein
MHREQTAARATLRQHRKIPRERHSLLHLPQCDAAPHALLASNAPQRNRLVGGSRAANENCPPRPLRVELGRIPVAARYPLRLNHERSAKHEECYRRARYPISVGQRDPPDRRDSWPFPPHRRRASPLRARPAAGAKRRPLLRRSRRDSRHSGSIRRRQPVRARGDEASHQERR